MLSFPQPLISPVPFPQSRDLLPHPLSLPAGCLGAACQGASSSKQAVPEPSIPSATALRGHLVTTAVLLRGHTIPAHYMAPWSIAPSCCGSSHEPKLRGSCSGAGRREDIDSGAGHVAQQPCARCWTWGAVRSQRADTQGGAQACGSSLNTPPCSWGHARDLFCPRYPSAAALNSRGPLSSCAAASSPWREAAALRPGPINTGQGRRGTIASSPSLPSASCDTVTAIPGGGQAAKPLLPGQMDGEQAQDQPEPRTAACQCRGLWDVLLSPSQHPCE